MYYSELERIENMKKMLERFAYISIGSDFLIAISTYLVLKNINSATSILLITDYLNLIQVICAGVIMVLIISLTHFKRTLNNFRLFVIRSRYRGGLRFFGLSPL